MLADFLFKKLTKEKEFKAKNNDQSNDCESMLKDHYVFKKMRPIKSGIYNLDFLDDKLEYDEKEFKILIYDRYINEIDCISKLVSDKSIKDNDRDLFPILLDLFCKEIQKNDVNTIQIIGFKAMLILFYKYVLGISYTYRLDQYHANEIPESWSQIKIELKLSDIYKDKKDNVIEKLYELNKLDICLIKINTYLQDREIIVNDINYKNSLYDRTIQKIFELRGNLIKDLKDENNK